MSRLQSLKWRRAGGYIGGTAFALLGFYLRCFVFLKFGPGAFLVYGSIAAGGLLIEEGRKAGRAIKTELLRN